MASFLALGSLTAQHTVAPHCRNRACSSGADFCSGSRVVALQRAQRQQQRTPLAAAAASSGAAHWADDDGEPADVQEEGFGSDDYYIDQGLPDGIEGKAGYTPYDFIDFTDIALKHEVVTKVDRPVSEVYALWADRLNWPDWFGMIEEVGFKEGEDNVCALNMWYRWAMTPWLELYVALRRTRAEVNKYIVEEPEDGAPIVAAALFQEGDGGGATLVTLRISYMLPRVLYEYAGQMAVYGDVDRKLSKCMARMKECIEGSDAMAVLAASEAAMADIRSNLPEHRRQQDESDAQWAAEKQRWAAQQQQQAAAAAVAQQADTEVAAAAEQLVQAAAAASEAAMPSSTAAPAKPKRKAPARKAGTTVSSGKTRRGTRKAADTDGA